MNTLAQLQLEHSFILTRLKMADSAASQIAADDVGGLSFPIVGAPERQLPSIVSGDLSASSCGLGTMNFWEAILSAWILTGGLAVEVVCVRDGHGGNINIFIAPGQFELKANNEEISWTVHTTANHTLTVAKVLYGWPQHVVCNYDIVAGIQSIYVDGALVASQTLSGAINNALIGNVVLLKGETTNSQAPGQDIAIYGAPLSEKQIKRHFQAFRQILPDPGHVRQFAQIGVNT